MPLELDLHSLRHGPELVKRGFARMQKGGVIMDVTNAEQAAISLQPNAGSQGELLLEATTTIGIMALLKLNVRI
jgi:pyridoxal 5'-phosphate synthase pdxS subunit